MSLYHGWTPEPKKLPTKQQLVNLRDRLLEVGEKDAAMAAENLIDILTGIASNELPHDQVRRRGLFVRDNSFDIKGRAGTIDHVQIRVYWLSKALKMLSYVPGGHGWYLEVK